MFSVPFFYKIFNKTDRVIVSLCLLDSKTFLNVFDKNCTLNKTVASYIIFCRFVKISLKSF